MLTVTGTLTDPLNTPAGNILIRVTALSNEGSLIGFTGSTTTGENGVYTFNLRNGKHKVEVLYSDEHVLVGEVIVDNATTTPLTLPELLTTYAAPVV